MKMTDVRSMRLSGPRPHSVGGADSTIGKWIVRVDTDAGIFGLGEADDFMGVGEAIAHIKPHLVGRSPFPDPAPDLGDSLRNPSTPYARTAGLG